MANVWKCELCGARCSAGVTRKQEGDSMIHSCNLETLGEIDTTLKPTEVVSIRGHARWVGWIEPAKRSGGG